MDATPFHAKLPSKTMTELLLFCLSVVSRVAEQSCHLMAACCLAAHPAGPSSMEGAEARVLNDMEEIGRGTRGKGC